jgi:splicing factor 3A subunit 3
MFESEWEMGSLFGWEEVILRLRGQSDNAGPLTADGTTNPLHCKACNKTFANENVFMHHKKGRPHIKAVSDMSKNVVRPRSEFSDQEVERLRTVALLETWILKLKQELLADVFQNTENLVRKKQSKHYTELEADYEMLADGKKKALGDANSDEEDERPKYNPKNLPMGWDGRPIPYWLYKLHGLGVEFKCEICGGASYWGQRAFEKHFQEWRHAYGMKCLKIPNTIHFKDVTDIEHALRLHKKIL